MEQTEVRERQERCYEVARQLMVRLSRDMNLETSEVALVICDMVSIFDGFLTDLHPDVLQTWRETVAGMRSDEAPPRPERSTSK